MALLVKSVLAVCLDNVVIQEAYARDVPFRSYKLCLLIT
jgi:hypothetical protein